jgi:peptide/nickel transport system substrate-binding protein
MKRLAAIVALALSGTALAGPSDNSLIVGTSQEPTALEPFVNNQAIAAEILGYMYRDVAYIDLQGRPQPDLATELPTEANGRVRITRNAQGAPTSMTVRWTLRPGIRWSDGRPITTEDFRSPTRSSATSSSPWRAATTTRRASG